MICKQFCDRCQDTLKNTKSRNGKIINTVRNCNKFGVRKYQDIKSWTKKGVRYVVAKVRAKNSRNYKYICSCPDFFFRQTICKHIRKFKLDEKRASLKAFNMTMK